MKLPKKIGSLKSKPCDLASLLKQGREDAGLTLRAVEAKTGISNAQISLLEQGKTTNPSARNFLKLVKLYNLSLEDAIMALK